VGSRSRSRAQIPQGKGRVLRRESGSQSGSQLIEALLHRASHPNDLMGWPGGR